MTAHTFRECVLSKRTKDREAFRKNQKQRQTLYPLTVTKNRREEGVVKEMLVRRKVMIKRK